MTICLFNSECDKRAGDFAIPTKAAYALLDFLFFGVEANDEAEKDIYTSSVGVSYKYIFKSKHSSAIDARNLSAREAIASLCEIEDKFTQRKNNEQLPDGFAELVQR